MIAVGDGQVTFTVDEILEILATTPMHHGSIERFRAALDAAVDRKAIIALNEEVSSR